MFADLWLRIMLGALAVSAVSCISPGVPPAVPEASRLSELTRAIAELDASILPGEAERAAHEALQATAELSYAYDMTSPPQLHNVLVNTGIRERGLCCHWAEDLVARILRLELESLEVHWVVANRGDLFREHNSALIVANGQPFERGLVLDGWRDSGELVWAHPATDRYVWEMHPLDGEWSDLHCREGARTSAEK